MASRPASCPPGDVDQHLAMKVLAKDQLDAAAALLAAGMRDNPVHVKAFGSNPDRRQQRLRQFLGPLLVHVHSNGSLLGAFMHGELIGVLGMMKPGRCRPARKEILRMASKIVVGNPPIGVWRIHRWLSVWARNDPPELHVHIGPLAVSQAWRGQGVGRELMMRCCQHVDALGAIAWLETDLAINVAFYETLGFVVARREPLLGVPNWFMRREPGAWDVNDQSPMALA